MEFKKKKPVLLIHVIQLDSNKSALKTKFYSLNEILLLLTCLLRHIC